MEYGRSKTQYKQVFHLPGLQISLWTIVERHKKASGVVYSNWKFCNVISLAVSEDWIKCELSVSIGWFCWAQSNKRQHTVLFSGFLLIFHQFCYRACAISLVSGLLLESVPKTLICSKCCAPSPHILKETRTHFPDFKRTKLVGRQGESEDQVKINFIYQR